MEFKQADFSKDLLYTAINQLWRIVAGPLVLIFIPLYLTPTEQGYWYTFTSIAALAVFADLGFSTIILQFAAHEFAYLHFNDDMTLAGDKEHLIKIATFFRFSVQWLIRTVGVIFPLIVIGGYFFLASKNELDNWQSAWVIYAVASGLVFFYSSLLYFFEGCNSVSLVQSLRFKIAVCTSLTILLGLYFQLNLYALSLSLIISSAIGCYQLIHTFYRAIKQLWRLSQGNKYDWWPEFSSLMWRYAISWSSGYFIFQLFTPLAFKFHSPIFAGKVGLSIAAWTAGSNIALTWITAITPKINMLIAEHKWNDLDRIFHKNLFRSMITMFVGGIIYFILYFVFVDKFMFFGRLLGPLSMLLLFACWILQLFINCLAVYLRAHKKEPLMLISSISALYVAITTYLCARYLADEYLFLGFFSSYIWGTPIVIYIWKAQKKLHYL